MQLTPGAWAVHPIRRARPSPATPNRCGPAGPMDAHAGEAVLLRQVPSSLSTSVSSRLRTTATRRIRRMLTRPRVRHVDNNLLVLVPSSIPEHNSDEPVDSVCIPLRKQKRWVQSEKVRQFIHHIMLPLNQRVNHRNVAPLLCRFVIHSTLVAFVLFCLRKMIFGELC
nr:uncharacterized protein LOC109760807 [Aegilops tauschii subsp. strangulata]